MNDSVKGLAAIRDEVLELAGVAERADEPEIAGRARAYAERLRTRTFDVAFVGEFKAGKSTLVNAICRRRVVATATTECTALVTTVAAAPPGTDDFGVLRYSNGTEDRVSFARASSETTLAGAHVGGEAPDNVDLYVSWFPDLGPDVRLVDTPGAGAAGLAREKVTIRYLPTADAIVYVTRADMAMNQSELRFIQERVTTQDVTRVLLVVNRADAIPDDRDRDELSRHLESQIGGIVPRERWSFVSAADAEELRQDGVDDAHPDMVRTGLPEFERRLRRFLIDERAAEEAARALAVLARCRDELRVALEQRVELAQLSAENRERRVERVRELQRYTREEMKAAAKRVDAAFEEMERRRVPELLAAVRPRAELRIAELAKQHDADPQSAARVLEDIAGWASTTVQSALIDELRAAQAEAARAITKVSNHISGELSFAPNPPPLPELDYRAMIQYEVVHEKVQARPVNRADDDDRLVMAGAVGLLASFLLGPVGLLAGAVMGWGLAGKAHEVVTELRETRRMRTKTIADDLEQRLRDAALASVRATSRHMRGQVEDVFHAKLAELDRRLDEAAQVDVSSVEHASLTRARQGLKAVALLGTERRD